MFLAMFLTRFAATIGLAAFVALMATGCEQSTDFDQKIDPTYTSIRTNIFAKNCTTSSCHSVLGQRGGMVLEGDAAYANLVNVPADNDTAHARGLVRVRPGQPDSSFLIIKLTGPAFGEGDRMPQGNNGLGPNAIAAIRTWIAGGALRN